MLTRGFYSLLSPKTTILGIAALHVLSSSASPFGTVDSPRLLNQHREHELITRAAFACRTGESPADGNCFEPISLDQVAGKSGEFGAVGCKFSYFE